MASHVSASSTQHAASACLPKLHIIIDAITGRISYNIVKLRDPFPRLLHMYTNYSHFLEQQGTHRPATDVTNHVMRRRRWAHFAERLRFKLKYLSIVFCQTQVPEVSRHSQSPRTSRSSAPAPGLLRWTSSGISWAEVVVVWGNSMTSRRTDTEGSWNRWTVR